MTDFNDYVSDYSERVAAATSFVECGHDFFLAAKADQFLELMDAAGGASSMNVLDVGCGIGMVERHLAGKVGRVVGIDIATDAVRAAAKNVPDALFLTYDGLHLPFREGSFDAASLVCVLHHVEPERWQAIVEEIARAVRPGGHIVAFEHNPWNPVTRYVVNHCDFDRGVTLLSAPHVARLFRGARLSIAKRQFLFFFPWLGRVWRAIERYLGWLPLGAQYLVFGTRTDGVAALSRGAERTQTS